MATTSAAWFQRVMWAGIIANLALAGPTLLWPAQMQALAEAASRHAARVGAILELAADPAQQLLRAGGD